MSRIAKTDIESRWYDVFTSWTRADRELALRVLTQIHKVIPDPEPKKAKAYDPKERKPQAVATLLDAAPDQFGDSGAGE